MESLRRDQEGLRLYHAGLPHFPRNFSRDSLLAGILAEDVDLLDGQLRFCATRQGSRSSPETGEEPGKVHHEYPGVRLRGLSTEFSACDTTALFLIGHEVHRRLSGSGRLAREQEPAIRAAAEYIQNHLRDGFFTEDPAFCGADRFALRVTYWKDAMTLGRDKREPAYPVVYPLAHVQSLRGIRFAGDWTGSSLFQKAAQLMQARLADLYDPGSDSFFLAIDAEGPVRGVSSDSLHALAYLEPDDLPPGHAEAIAASSAILETGAGYRTIDPALAGKGAGGYHTRTVWPFEQAMIHRGAVRFDLPRAAEVSSRVVRFLDTAPEYLDVPDGDVVKGGCDPQLWTIAAKRYFLEKAVRFTPSAG